MEELRPKDIAPLTDITLLKAVTSTKEIKDLCKAAHRNHFFSVCVNPHFVPIAKQCLEKSDTKVCTVIGFPLGATSPEAKAFETKTVAKQGADEVDMVLNISALKSKDWKHVQEDMEAVVNAAPKRVLTKVILETCYLSDSEIRKACRIALDSGLDYVKTSTGFGDGGATLETVGLMKKTVGDRAKVKASGGIRNFETACQMIVAGASRLGVGSSAALQIIAGEESRENY